MHILAAGTAGKDFSMLGLMLEADPVVQAVVVMLILASVLCWALIIEKMIRVGGLKRQSERLDKIARTGSFEDKDNSRVVHAVKEAAAFEASEGAFADEDQNDRRARLERAMRGAMKKELQRAESGLSFFATVGSAAPFIGLFGTVWGIMNSFTSIAQSEDTSLAVVAPGIAEALFATAIGLAAAIPAVIAYNQFAVALGRRADEMGGSIAVLAKKFARSPDVARAPARGAA